jgi:hypothetical protein
MMQNSLKTDNSEEDLRLAFRVFDKVFFFLTLTHLLTKTNKLLKASIKNIFF